MKKVVVLAILLLTVLLVPMHAQSPGLHPEFGYTLHVQKPESEESAFNIGYFVFWETYVFNFRDSLDSLTGQQDANPFASKAPLIHGQWHILIQLANSIKGMPEGYYVVTRIARHVPAQGARQPNAGCGLETFSPVSTVRIIVKMNADQVGTDGAKIALRYITDYGILAQK